MGYKLQVSMLSLFLFSVGDVTYVEMLETPDGKSKGVA